MAPFLHLPLEVRTRIYGFCFEHLCLAWSGRPLASTPPTPPLCLSLLFVSRQVSQEAREVLLRTAQIDVTALWEPQDLCLSPRDLANPIKNLRDHGFLHHVRLGVDFNTDNPQASVQIMLSALPTLKSLTLCFSKPWRFGQCSQADDFYLYKEEKMLHDSDVGEAPEPERGFEGYMKQRGYECCPCNGCTTPHFRRDSFLDEADESVTDQDFVANLALSDASIKSIMLGLRSAVPKSQTIRFPRYASWAFFDHVNQLRVDELRSDAVFDVYLMKSVTAMRMRKSRKRREVKHSVSSQVQLCQSH
jgi:hypothetical protein